MLRGAGFDTETVLSEQLGGAVDPIVLDACTTEGRVLVTLDLDFANLRAYPPVEQRGIWVLRPPQQTVRSILALMRGAVKLLSTERFEARLWVVEIDQIRIRE